jgi:peptidoglycan/LPS O-acetylase OafA/YrhL
MNQKDNVSAHETNLDFIRAVAVLIVVASHLALFFGNLHIGFLEPSLIGKFGVVIFFVHSGIVNMFSIERHVQQHGEYRLFRAFMIRRSFRIYPLSIFVVLAIFFTKLPASHIANFIATIGQHANAELVPSLLLVQNFVRFDQILGPLWSLPYEVQIYCLFPMIYLILRRFSSTRAILFAWAILAAVDQLIAPRLAKHGYVGSSVVIPDLLFYFLLFLAGLCAYKEMQTSRRLLHFWLLPALLAFMCVAWLLSYDNIKCIFLSLSLGLALPHIQSCEISALKRICGWVAKYSYGIYLLHDPAIWLGFVRLGNLPIMVRFSAFMLATFGGSILIYHALEHPMILIGNKAAVAISRKKIPAKVRVAAAIAGASV